MVKQLSIMEESEQKTIPNLHTKNNYKIFFFICLCSLTIIIVLFIYYLFFYSKNKINLQSIKTITPTEEPIPSVTPVKNQSSEILIDALKGIIFNDVFYSSIYYKNDICEYSDQNGNNCVGDDPGICDYYLCWDGKNGLANTTERKNKVTEKYKNFTKTIRTGSIKKLNIGDSTLIFKTPNYFKMSLSELQKIHSEAESGVLADVPTAFASPVYVDKDQILWSEYRCSTGWAPDDNDPDSVKKNFENCNLISNALDIIFNKKSQK